MHLAVNGSLVVEDQMVALCIRSWVRNIKVDGDSGQHQGCLGTFCFLFFIPLRFILTHPYDLKFLAHTTDRFAVRRFI